MTFIRWNLQFNSLPWYCLPFKILRIFISTFLDLYNRPWISFRFLPAKCSPLTDNNSSPLLNCLFVFDFASFLDSTSKIRMWSLLSSFTYIDRKIPGIYIKEEIWNENCVPNLVGIFIDYCMYLANLKNFVANLPGS